MADNCFVHIGKLKCLEYRPFYPTSDSNFQLQEIVVHLVDGYDDDQRIDYIHCNMTNKYLLPDKNNKNETKPER